MSKKILVVDDERTTSTMVKQKLERAGYKVKVALNGFEACEILKKHKMDLVISDVEMPIMDGVDLYKNLKKEKKTSLIPFVVLTNDDLFKNAFAQLGVEGFIGKPINQLKILEVVESVLGKNSSGEVRSKVLISGNDKDILKQMESLLKEYLCEVSRAESGAEVIGNALTIKPNIIILDILIKDTPTIEVIQALKCIGKLRDTHFITYSYFTPEQLGDVSHVDQLKELQRQYTEKDIAKYIGRFNKTSFIDGLREFGI